MIRLRGDKRARVQRRKLLFVEGINDARFCEAILARLGSADSVEIVPVESKVNFGPVLRLFAEYDDFDRVERLAMIRDSDDDPHGAFASLRATAESIGLVCRDPRANEWLTASSGVRVLLATIPAGKPGCLEDVCWSLIRDAGVKACADAFIACCDRAHADQAAAMSPSEKIKRRVGVYLAGGVSERGSFASGISVGLAAELGLFDLSAPEIGWLSVPLSEM